MRSVLTLCVLGGLAWVGAMTSGQTPLAGRPASTSAGASQSSRPRTAASRPPTFNWRSADWPGWRGPTRNGISQERISLRWPSEGPRRLWRTQLSLGYASMAVSNAKVYTTGWERDQDVVYCIDGDIGNIIWTHRYPSKAGPYPGTRATPALDGKWLYTTGRNGDVLCLNADTGEVRWKVDLTAAPINAKPPIRGFSSSPLVSGEVVIVDAGVVVALDKSRGELVWKSDNFAPGYASPVKFQAGGEDLLGVFNAHGPAVLRAKDGTTYCMGVWKTENDANVADPLVIGERLFYSSGSEMGCFLWEPIADGPKSLWRNHNLSTQMSCPLYYEGCIFGLDGDWKKVTLKCLDAATSKVRWTGPSMEMGTMILADGSKTNSPPSGKLIILSDSGELIIARAGGEAYQELARAKVMGGQCWTTPVLSGGRLYCRNTAGEIICLNLKPF